MSDVADIQQLMERAEGAAHSGDFAAAEDALRLAVELQERTLGPSSPEVASTLNNLAIVYERLDRPADAEACYRKSFAIAKAVFGHDHPLVETSATNLRDFCDARGIAFERPQTAKAPARIESDSAPSRRPMVLGAVVVVAALIATVMFMWRREATPASMPAPVPAPATPAPEPPAPAPVASQPAPVASEPPAPRAAAVPKATPAPPQTAAPVTVEVLDARLCRSLDLEANWRCDPLPASTSGGTAFFVTRLKAAGDTTVEHRWYRNDRLTQAVTLRVRATDSGYRTYSRTTAGADRAGTWRVEVRDRTGAVLAEKTFVVGPS